MTLIIKNAKTYDMADIKGEIKDIIIKDGKIFEILDPSDDKIDVDEIIDANNRIVTPGFIESNSSLGLQDAIFPDGNDKDEVINPVNSSLRAIDGINPKDESFEDAIKSGVTTIVSGPGSLNLIGGTCAAIKPYGKIVDEMAIKEEICFKFSLCQDPKMTYSKKSISPTTRLGSSFLLREALAKALEYHNSDKKIFNFELDSLSRVFDNMLVKIEAREAQDIISAVRIAEEFSLNYVIEAATEAYLIPEFIKKHSVKIILGPVYGGKRTHELRNSEAVSGKILEDNKIKFSVSTGHPKCDIRLFNLNAIMMYRKGMDWFNLLESMTINPAKMLELDKNIGSLEKGKDADIVIWSGDPFDMYTFADEVIINGNRIYTR